MAHFISKLSDADSEAAETQAWLDFALLCGYISADDFKDLTQVRVDQRRACENDGGAEEVVWTATLE